MSTVLLIDDDRDFSFFIERVFRQRASDVNVFRFHDGTGAIDHLRLCGRARPVPDLVLLDLFFKEGPDGFDVLRATRAVEALSQVPVYMLSSLYRVNEVSQAKELGADDYLEKPTGDKWGDLVQTILAERPWGRKEIVRVSFAPEAVPVRPVDSPARSMFPGVAEHHTDDFFAACRYASINPRVAMNTAKSDKILDAKRRLVVRWLLTFPSPLPWGTIEIQEFIEVSERYIEKCRAENRRIPLPVCGFRSLTLTN